MEGLGEIGHVANSSHTVIGESMSAGRMIEEGMPSFLKMLFMEELESTGENPEMLELLDNLVVQLESCTNREYFQAKKEALIDSVSELDELEVADVPVDE